ncbi:MAG: hypothetical protein WC315_00705 [Candidatus Omnitrophota bacterium]|jgi:hypothetical protein
MAQVVLLKPRVTVQDLKMVELDLGEAEIDAREEGYPKMADCLGRMKAAIRSMLFDLGEAHWLNATQESENH